MNKALNGQFLWGAFALSFAALFTACQSTPTRTAAELRPLQGYWEGDAAAGKSSITITGNSLHYYARTDFWFETTFTLPAGTDPQQLHATIKNSSPPTNSIGQVVVAIFKIEDGTLTLAYNQDPEGSPEPFSTTRTRRFSHRPKKPTSREEYRTTQIRMNRKRAGR
jgi:uncharacterized protein (TIGR03067 family)